VTLVVALLLVGLSTAQLIYRYFLPTDGWAVTFEELDSPQQLYFGNLAGMPSDLRPFDVVTGIEGRPLGEYTPGERPDFWSAGRTVEYTVDRGGEVLRLDVPLGRWTLGALLANQVAFPSTAVTTLGASALFAVAAFAFYRRPNDPAAQMLMIFASAFAANVISGLLPADFSVQFDPLAYTVSSFFSFTIFGILLAPSLLAFTLVFPRPKRSVTRFPWLVLVPFGIGLVVAVILYSGGSAYFGWVPTLLMLVASIASLVHSAFTMRDAVSRAQLMWAFGGLVVGIGLFLLNFPSAFGWVSESAAPWFAGVASLGIPVMGIGLGVAVLRYRLFDVDVIIRRTTSYAILTALLALVYFGSVVLLQRVFAPFTGESDVAVVLSTLLIAALFLPLRRRVQDIIDRRFFRKKYDAEQVLNRFAATARDETDLDALTAELVRVIQETMQPEHVSVWLKPSGRRNESVARGALPQPRNSPSTTLTGMGEEASG
jgi:hypothetical protein